MSSSQFKVSRQILENVWLHKKLTSKQKVVIWKCRKKARLQLKQSDFSKQLQNYTKLSIFYGNLPISGKKQHKRTYTYLNKQKSLLLNLESRLDVLLVRANFCATHFTARQLISHGKVFVNYNNVTFAGFVVSVGDIISISEDHLELTKSIIKDNLRFNRICHFKPSHLEVNYKILNIVLLYEPFKIQFPYKIELDIL
jgi:small subunit ribosomal protein S4